MKTETFVCMNGKNYGPSCIATIKLLLRRTLVRLVILFSIISSNVNCGND